MLSLRQFMVLVVGSRLSLIRWMCSSLHSHPRFQFVIWSVSFLSSSVRFSFIVGQHRRHCRHFHIFTHHGGNIICIRHINIIHSTSRRTTISRFSIWILSTVSVRSYLFVRRKQQDALSISFAGGRLSLNAETTCSSNSRISNPCWERKRVSIFHAKGIMECGGECTMCSFDCRGVGSVSWVRKRIGGNVWIGVDHSSAGTTRTLFIKLKAIIFQETIQACIFDDEYNPF